MNKKRNFAKMALLGALLCGLASPTFVGCKDYDDDIKDLQEQITSNKKEIDDILKKIKDGQYVQKVEPVAEGIKITLGSGEVVTIKNGTNGTNGVDGINGTNGVDGINGTNGVDGVSPVLHIEPIDGVDWFVDQNGVKVGKVPVPTPGEPGEPGEPGTPGVSGKSPYIIGESDVNGLTTIGNWAIYDDATKVWKDSGVKAVNTTDIHLAYVVEGINAFELNVWNDEKEAYETFQLAKAVDYIQSLVFNPSYHDFTGVGVPVYRLFANGVGLLTSNMNIDFILTPLAARPNIKTEDLSFLLKETISRAAAPSLVVNGDIKNLDNGFSLNVSLKDMDDAVYSDYNRGWLTFLQVKNDKFDYTTTAIRIVNRNIYTSSLNLHDAEGNNMRDLAYNSDEIVDLNSEIKLYYQNELLESMNFDLKDVVYTVECTYENYAGDPIATADAAGFVIEDNTVKMKEAKTNYIGNKCIANVVAKLGEVELGAVCYTITVTAEPIVVTYANDEIFGQDGAAKEWANANVNFYFGSATASSDDFQKKLYTTAGCATLADFLALVNEQEFAQYLGNQPQGVKFVWYGANTAYTYKGLRIVAPLTAEWKTYDLAIDIPLNNGTVVKFSTTIDLTMPDLSGVLVKRPAFWEGNQMLIVGSKDGANPYLMEGNLLDAYNSFTLPDGVTLSFKKENQAATVTLNDTQLTWAGSEFDGTNNIVSLIPVLTYGNGFEEELTSFDAKFVNPVKALTWTFAAKTLTDNADAVQLLPLNEGLAMKDRFGDALIEANGTIKGDYATIYGLEVIKFTIVKVEVDGVEVEYEAKLSITNNNELAWNNVGGAAIVKPMTVILKASMVNAWGVQESQVVTVTVNVNSGN